MRISYLEEKNIRFAGEKAGDLGVNRVGELHLFVHGSISLQLQCATQKTGRHNYIKRTNKPSGAIF
jgi:hypothetical protein